MRRLAMRRAVLTVIVLVGLAAPVSAQRPHGRVKLAAMTVLDAAFAPLVIQPQ